MRNDAIVVNIHTKSRSVYSVLADIFNRSGYMERKGRGFEKIVVEKIDISDVNLDVNLWNQIKEAINEIRKLRKEC